MLSFSLTFQVTKECKLGSRTEVDLVEVENKLDASLDLRWPSKVASQVARHDTTMTQFQVWPPPLSPPIGTVMVLQIITLLAQRTHLSLNWRISSKQILQYKHIGNAYMGVGCSGHGVVHNLKLRIEDQTYCEAMNRFSSPFPYQNIILSILLFLCDAWDGIMWFLCSSLVLAYLMCGLALIIMPWCCRLTWPAEPVSCERCRRRRRPWQHTSWHCGRRGTTCTTTSSRPQHR